MMEVSLYNTLTREMEVVRPTDGKVLRFYCCGPTVYGPAHIGNLRTFVAQDVFRRVVEFFGMRTCHVRNITDVDDKTIRESQKVGQPLQEFTEKWHTRFTEDCGALNLLRPEHEPSAVAHLPEQIRLIERLIEGGHAYSDGDGSVYYRIDSFANYGKLSRLDLSAVRRNASARLNDNDEYGKESWQDFALWKAWKCEDGKNGWGSPWGLGRPGWHIECSAMSMRYLGESFDLHSGGVDLIFPHHENEIAQSEAATGKPFAKLWFHIAHLRVNGEKMSKSLGNLYTLEDVVERGFSPEALRYLLLSGHYRQPLNFTWESLAAAESALKRIRGYAADLEVSAESHENGVGTMETDAFRDTLEALCVDLNTPKALGALNRTLRDLRGGDDCDGAAVRRDLARVLQLFGLPFRMAKDSSEIVAPAEVEALAVRREEARRARNWEEADTLREALRARGWEMRDLPTGYSLKRLVATDGPENSFGK